MTFDAADKKILTSLQQNARIGLETLAQDTGLSIASVQRRIKRLRETEVILSDVTLLDPKKLKYYMTFIVMVELEHEQLHQLDAFTRRVQGEPQVQQCYYVTGEADYCLICLARDIEDFEDLTHRLFFNNANVRRFRTNVVLSRKKVGLVIPIDD
jgi:DNA-binding Lrp family transcriptional regulator